MRNSYRLLPLMVLLGCHFGSTERSKPVAAPTSSPPLQPANAAAPSRSLQLSPANTSISFTGSNALTSHVGYFDAFEGTLETPTENPKDLKIRVVVNMESTKTKIGLLTKHLKAEDFFDVARYPTSEFVTDSIRPLNEAGRYEISGRLTLHGTEKPIVFPARISITSDEVAFDATMTILQTEFGMVEAARKTKNEVPVTVSIRCPRR